MPVSRTNPYEIKRTGDSVILNLLERRPYFEPDCEATITIPFSGKIEEEMENQYQWRCDNHQGPLDYGNAGRGTYWKEFPGVCVNITAPISYGRKCYHEARLLWIKERGEWVAIEARESYEDEMYSGPYSLSEPLAKNILEAYNIDPSKLPLEKVKATAPEDLEKIAAAL